MPGWSDGIPYESSAGASMSPTTHVDPCGLRFAATLTSIVLALALLTTSPLNITLLALQAIAFGLGALGSLQRAPYGLLFTSFVRPRLDPPAHTEDSRPPRFAQLVGLGFVTIALLGFATGSETLGQSATALALVAALLNATTGFCLGCGTYLLIRRLARAASIPATAPTATTNPTTTSANA